MHLIGGKRRAAPASARGTGRAAYTKDVKRAPNELTGYGAHTPIELSATLPPRKYLLR